MRHSQFRYTPQDSAGLFCGYYQMDRSYYTKTSAGTPDWVLIYTISGKGCFRFAKGNIIVSDGDVIVTRPFTAMDYLTAPGADTWELAWAHFQPRPQWLEWLQWHEADPGTMVTTVSGEARSEVEAAMTDMNKLTYRASASRYFLVMNALERAILWAGGADTDPRIDSRVSAAIEYMLERIDSKVTIDGICAAVRLSPSRLGHLFHEQTGKTPLQYLEEERMARACEQLRVTNRSIAAIATDLGYESAFYFSRRFSMAMGASPSEYRKSQS